MAGKSRYFGKHPFPASGDSASGPTGRIWWDMN